MPNEWDGGNSLSVVAFPKPSPVLNVVLHIIYGRSCRPYNPSGAALLDAVDTLVAHGVAVQTHIVAENPIFELFLAAARSDPLPFYACAGQHRIESLAVPISALLLGHRVYDFPDAMVERMGPVYLKRLVGLQQRRLEILRSLLIQPPEIEIVHDPTSDCDQEEQQAVVRAWMFMSTYLIVEARAGKDYLPTGDELRSCCSRDY